MHLTPEEPPQQEVEGKSGDSIESHPALPVSTHCSLHTPLVSVALAFSQKRMASSAGDLQQSVSALHCPPGCTHVVLQESAVGRGDGREP